MHYKAQSISKIRKKCFWVDKKGIGLITASNKYMKAQNSPQNTESHQLNTAFIVAELGLDAETVSAALVHEVLFEAHEKKEGMEKVLGREVTGIAEDIARLKSIKKKNYKKMPHPQLAKVIMGIAKDFRSLFVELASQLDKIRNISQRKKDQREPLVELAREVYAPIAHKLGLYELEWEMLDLTLKYFEPKSYQKIKKLIGKKRRQREELVHAIKKDIESILKKEGISAKVTGRAKSFSGIHKKMKEQGKSFEQISDLHGVRIICESVEDCYRAMSLVHLNFKPLGEYDDYIASPKKNKYQSIHTVFDWHGNKAEAQIRTWGMHRTAEEGIAAHWRYKQLETDKEFDQRLSWAKQLIEWQRELKKKESSMKSLRIGFGDREIFALTPKKEIISLPEGGTALDFAYAVHSDIGDKCKFAIVNGKISKLDKELVSGDVVEINTANTPQVKASWLNLVKTEKAKSRIRKKAGIKARTKKEEKSSQTTTSTLKKVVVAKCCHPLPGEEITGYRTTKRKVTIHSSNCPFLSILQNERKIKIGWGEKHNQKYGVKIKVKALERAGIIIDLLTELEKQGVTIHSTETKSESGETIKCVFEIELKDSKQYEKLKKSLLSVPSVIEVGR